MTFTPVPGQNWKRQEYFDHYFYQVPCTYSMTVELDVTAVRKAQRRLYPAMLHLLAMVVNRHEEFRMAIGPDGKPGVYSEMHPCYTIFHPEDETFSNIWTLYDPDWQVFLKRYEEDKRLYGENRGMTAKENVPENTFPVSMIAWASFTAFNLNLQKGYDYLPPIFTMGKLSQRGDRWLLPLAAQVHHSVCDGFHLSRFLSELQQELDRMESLIPRQ